MAPNHLVAGGVPCLTAKAHNTSYPAISPLRPDLSLRGKKVVLTGAGIGIGRESARAFAAAGADSLFLLGGRRKELLEATAQALTSEFDGLTVGFAAVDMADSAAVQDIISTAVQDWDVLLLNAGYLPTPSTILKADLDDWTKCWEIGLNGNLHVIKALLPKRNPSATIIATSSCMFNLDGGWAVGLAPYAATKIAMAKLFEVFAVEVPDVHWVTFHPGSVVTDMLNKSGLNQPHVPKDDATLPAHFAVWLTSAKARFLQGKFVWANWDVEELEERASEIHGSPMLTTNVVGWPFGFSGEQIEQGVPQL